MKWIICIPFLFTTYIYSQKQSIYKVTNFYESPPEGIPKEIEVEMEVNSSAGYCLLETHFLKENSIFRNDGDIQSTLIDYEKNASYSFDNKLRILEVYFLRSDTLVSTDKTVSYNGYMCDVYELKQNPTIKIYACKTISNQVNPGIKYVHESNIGGIVRIEMQRKNSKLVYQLIRNEKSKKHLTPYIKQSESSQITPKEARSILGSSN